MTPTQSQRAAPFRHALCRLTMFGLVIGPASYAVGDDPPTESGTSPLREVDGPSEHGGLGLTYLSSSRGVMVAEVQKGGPGDEAGIRKGDWVISIGGDRIATAGEAVNRVSGMAPGTQVLVKIRRGQDLLEAPATLGAQPDAVRRPDGPPADNDSEPMQFESARAVPREVDLGWNLEVTKEGLMVERVEAGSPAAKANLQTQDILVSIAGEKVLTPEAVSRALNQFDAESRVEITLERAGETISYLLQLPPDHERDLTQDQPDPLVRNSGERRSADRGNYLTGEESDIRQLLMEIVRELRYQRQLLQSMQASGGSDTGGVIGGGFAPAQPFTQPDDTDGNDGNDDGGEDGDEDDADRVERRRGPNGTRINATRLTAD